MNVQFYSSVKSGATGGNSVFLNTEFFENISQSAREYLLAHEISHIRYRHMDRLFDRRREKKRDLNLWNLATDAVINANLQRDGIIIPKR